MSRPIVYKFFSEIFVNFQIYFGSKPGIYLGPSIVPSVAFPIMPCERSLIAMNITSSSGKATIESVSYTHLTLPTTPYV